MIPRYPYYGKETKCEHVPITFPPQHQNVQPGIESIMNPLPIYDNPYYKGSGKLHGKVAIITGGDSGIGRAVAIAFAKEGANVVIVYLNETQDAATTKQVVEKYGRQCLLIEGDLRRPSFSLEIVQKTLECFGRIDSLIHNQAIAFHKYNIMDISDEQMEDVFRTNTFPLFYLTKAALPYLRPESTIISTASVTAYLGWPMFLDYAASKGAMISFTRSLSNQLVGRGIRVNAVAPGAVWTPLIVASYPADEVKFFGSDSPMKRAAQPFELAPTYVYLASDDSSYMTGQVIHVNGGFATET